MSHDKPEESWRLEKSISLPNIFALIMAAITFSIWGARLESTVNQTSDRTKSLELWRDSKDGIEIKTESRLAVIEDRTKVQADTMSRIENKLDQQMEMQVRQSHR